MPLFDAICYLAKMGDAQGLRWRIDEEKVCIDAQKGIYAPITWLAQQREDEAVTFLINEFHANRDLAAMGYAQGGYTDQVDKLLTLEVNLDWVAKGYARGGHIAQVNKLLAQGATLFSVIEGYAQGGHIAQIDRLLNVDDTSLNDELLLQFIALAIKGYAQGGYTEQVETLLAQGERRNWATVLGNEDGYIIAAQNPLAEAFTLQSDTYLDWAIKQAIEGYAQSGNTKKVNELLDQVDGKRYALKGYAQGGHIAQVNKLLALDFDPASAFKGYAQGGHMAQIDRLMHDVRLHPNQSVIDLFIGGNHSALFNFSISVGHSLFCVIDGYARGGHIAQANKIWEDCKRGLTYVFNRQEIPIYLPPHQHDEIHSSAIKGYIKGGYEKNDETLLRVATLTDNQLLREKLAGNPNYLLKKSSALREGMKKNNMSYSWARAWTPALIFLFLQGYSLMDKGKLPLEMLLKISSFITGFSDDATYIFLNQHYKPLQNGGNISLFKKQASLFDSINAVKDETNKNESSFCVIL